LEYLVNITGEYSKSQPVSVTLTITPYGLITYLAKTYRGHCGYIVYNTENLVIQSLLFECLEEETIDSFSSLKGFPTREI
jgi:hypothetical protein